MTIRPVFKISCSFSLLMAGCLLLWPLNGCNSPSPSDAGSLGEAAVDQSSLTDVVLIAGDQSTYENLLAQYHGQVILVDFWATWCAPCVQQFPHTVSLSLSHIDEGLAVISVSMNEPEEQAAVLSFLTKQGATFDNLITPYGAGAQFLEAFDLRGDIPFYKLYDRQGALRYTFSGDPDGLENCEPIQRIDDRVAQLLAENRQ